MGKWIQKLPSKSKSECGKPAIYVYQCNLNLFVLEKYCYEKNDSIDGWKYILTTPTVSVGQESRLSWGPLAQGHPRDCHQAVGRSWIVISRLNTGKSHLQVPPRGCSYMPQKIQVQSHWPLHRQPRDTEKMVASRVSNPESKRECLRQRPQSDTPPHLPHSTP